MKITLTDIARRYASKVFDPFSGNCFDYDSMQWYDKDRYKTIVRNVLESVKELKAEENQ